MSLPQLPSLDWSGEQPLYVTHRGAQNLWNVESHMPTLFGNHSVVFGAGTLCVVVDEAGQPIENMYGYAYKEYAVSNSLPEGYEPPAS